MTKIFVVHHVNLNASHANRAFNPHRDFVFIIGDPYGHFFSTFEYCTLDKKRLEFDGVELSVLGFYRFLSNVPDVHREKFLVEKERERNFIAGFVAVKIDIPCVVN